MTKNSTKKIPRLRFKGFEGEWEEKRLGDNINYIVGNDLTNADIPILTISARYGWMNQKDRFGNIIAGKELSKYTLLKRGELSYNHGNSKLAKYGAVFELKNYDKALVPRVYHSFKMSNNNNSTFIEYLFASKIPDRQLRKLITSGARMDGLLNINKKSFASIKINIPRPTEQQKIGLFFAKLDQLIDLQSKKVEQLKKLKRGYLQKMFPQKGESVPRLRFDGFSGEWKEERLGNIVSWKRGKGLSKNSINNNKSGSKVVHYADIYKFNAVLNKVIHWSKTSEGVTVPANSLIFPMSDVTPDGLARTSAVLDKGIKAGGDVLIASLPADFDSKFVSYYTNNLKNKILSLVTGTTVKHINSSALSTLKIKYPSLSEQKKISNLFLEIDSSVYLKNKYIDKLNELKKSYLQKMFC